MVEIEKGPVVTFIKINLILFFELFKWVLFSHLGSPYQKNFSE